MVDGLVKRYDRRQTIIQTLVAIAIFISGIIVGGAGTIFGLKGRGLLHPSAPPTAKHIANEIGSDYDLTQQQIKQVEAVFEKGGQFIAALRQDFDSKIEIGKETILNEMKTVLPPEKYEQWKQDFNARHHRHPKQGPVPGD
jgi:hypothetical protein